MKLIISVHPEKPEAATVRSEMVAWLVARGHEVMDEEREADMALALGGDGFMVRSVARFSPRGIPTLGINAGDVGFLTSGNITKWESVLKRLTAGRFLVERRVGLALHYRGKDFGPLANDVYLRHSDSIAFFKVKLDGHTLYREFGADGITISTPTGSTGYNIASGGPIVQPGVSCMVLAPISSMHLNTKPIVIGANARVTVEVTREKPQGNVFIIADGKNLGTVSAGEKIVVRRHPARLLFAILGHHDFYRALQGKKGLMK